MRDHTNVCICIYVYMYICIYVCIQGGCCHVASVSINVICHAWPHKCLYLYICVYVYMYICMYSRWLLPCGKRKYQCRMPCATRRTCLSQSMYVYMYVCIYIYIYIHTHTYTHTYTYTEIDTYMYMFCMICLCVHVRDSLGQHHNVIASMLAMCYEGRAFFTRTHTHTHVLYV